MLSTAIAVGKWLLMHPFQVLCVVLGVMLAWEHGALKRERTEHAADVATLNGNLESYKAHALQADANVAALEAAKSKTDQALADATKLAEANAAARADADARAAAATKRLGVLKVQLAAANQRERQARISLYASDPDCAAWSRTPVCGGIDQFLRFGGQKGPGAAGAGGHDSADSGSSGSAPVPSDAGLGYRAYVAPGVADAALTGG